MKSRLLRRLALVGVGLVLGGGVLAATGFGLTGPSGSIVAARYSLTLDGFEIASFSELKSINQEVTPVDYLSSDEKGVILSKLPGQLPSPKVTLSGPMTQSLELAAWHEAVRQGTVATGRRSVTLVFYNSQGAPVARYFLEKAWPSKLEITSPAKLGDPLIQTVTFAAEYLQRMAL